MWTNNNGWIIILVVTTQFQAIALVDFLRSRQVLLKGWQKSLQFPTLLEKSAWIFKEINLRVIKLIWEQWKGQHKDKHDKRKSKFKPLDVKHDQYNYFKQPTLKGDSRVTEYTRQKKPLQVKCWKCRGDHYLSKCPERKNRNC